MDALIYPIEGNPKIKTPTRILLVGESGSGKTNLCLKLLSSKCFENRPDCISYFYSIYQPIYDSFKKCCPKITFHEGLPQNEHKFSENSLIILDDLQNEIINSELCYKLFTVLSHHKNVTVIALFQGLYLKGKFSVIINRQFNHIFLLSLRRDLRQVKTLACSIEPVKVKQFMRTFDEVTNSAPFSFLWVCLCPFTSKYLKYRTTLPCEDKQIVYLM